MNTLKTNAKEPEPATFTPEALMAALAAIKAKARRLEAAQVPEMPEAIIKLDTPEGTPARVWVASPGMVSIATGPSGNLGNAPGHGMDAPPVMLKGRAFTVWACFSPNGTEHGTSNVGRAMQPGEGYVPSFALMDPTPLQREAVLKLVREAALAWARTLEGVEALRAAPERERAERVQSAAGTVLHALAEGDEHTPGRVGGALRTVAEAPEP